VGYFDNSTGTVAAHYEYGPFGELIRESGAKSETFSFRFSTKYEDAETGLLYYGFRYYDATTGRWLSRDPIGEQGGLNLYGMVGNDAVDAWDYLGLNDAKKMAAGFGAGDNPHAYYSYYPGYSFLSWLFTDTMDPEYEKLSLRFLKAEDRISYKSRKDYDEMRSRVVLDKYGNAPHWARDFDIITLKKPKALSHFEGVLVANYGNLGGVENMPPEQVQQELKFWNEYQRSVKGKGYSPTKILNGYYQEKSSRIANRASNNQMTKKADAAAAGMSLFGSFLGATADAMNDFRVLRVFVPKERWFQDSHCKGWFVQGQGLHQPKLEYMSKDLAIRKINQYFRWHHCQFITAPKCLF
jgi:RHS repeat-associated protein